VAAGRVIQPGGSQAACGPRLGDLWSIQNEPSINMAQSSENFKQKISWELKPKAGNLSKNQRKLNKIVWMFIPSISSDCNT